MFGLELWFVMATTSAVVAGISAFYVKVVAKKGYDSGLFFLYSAGLFLPVYLILAFWLDGIDDFSLPLAAIVFAGGFIAAITAVFKVQALKYIDTTIYFPLFKVVSPLLAIVFGILYFRESFSATEWFGLVLSLLVPLLLINKFENHRQNNLFLGIVLVIFTGALAAIIAAANKYAIDLYGQIYWLLLFSNVGVGFGSLAMLLTKKNVGSVYAQIAGGLQTEILYDAFWRGLTIGVSFAASIYAFAYGGPLGIVYTINSMYILIPIVLSIIYYGEHWNLRKVAAIVLSIAALALLQ